MNNKKVISKRLFDKAFSSISNIKDILISKLYIKHYSNSEIFIIKIKGIEMLVKISTNISKEYDEYTLDNAAEIKILKLLKKEFLDKNATPCIVEILYDLDKNSDDYTLQSKTCEYYKTHFSETPEELIEELICKHQNLSKAKISDGNTNFLILELCNMTLGSFLKNYIYIQFPMFKSILFMILATLYMIKSKFPDFHHGDLHTNNIMLILDEKYYPESFDIKTLTFVIDEVKYVIPFYGIIPKLIDFGFSSIPSMNINNAHTKDKYFVYSRTKNDFIWLLHDIYLDVHGRYGTSNIESMLFLLDPRRRFIKIDPEYIGDKDDIVKEYKNLLNHNLFKEYRTFKGEHKNLHTYRN